MKAIILAAGKGTRFLPITNKMPKCLIEINNKPILEYILEQLPDEIDEIILVTAHLEDKIKEYFGNSFKNTKIIYKSMSDETKYGTAIAVFTIKDIIKNDEKFLVLNSDDLVLKSDLENIINIKNNFVFAIHKDIPKNTKFLDIKTENDRIIGFEKIEELKPINIATGVYKLDSNIFNYEPYLLKNGEYSLPHTILNLSKNYFINSYEMKNWLPINDLNELDIANKKIINFFN